MLRGEFRERRCGLFYSFLFLVLFACEDSEGTSSSQRATPQARSGAAVSLGRGLPLPRVPSLGDEQREAPSWLRNLTADRLQRYCNRPPLTGYRLGHDFQIADAVFERSIDGWRLILTRTPLDYPTDPLLLMERIELKLNGEPHAGARFSLPLANQPGARWLFENARNGEGVWNAEGGFQLEITRWEQRPYDPEQGSFQVVGEASFLLMLLFTEGESNSPGEAREGWLSGLREQAVIRVLGAVTEPPEAR